MLPQSPQQDRLLASILFTDVVSFSKRMGENEQLTIKLVKRDFEIMSQLCQEHEGKIIKSTGDGLLMLFYSAVQAVSCALKIQQSIADAALTLPIEEVLSHRIGIHIGDIYFDGTDVIGNGVNIAARLEGVAQPGTICISQAVYDVIKHSLSLNAICLGTKQLKNIQEDIILWQLSVNSSSEFPTTINSLAKPEKTQIQNHSDYRSQRVLLNKVKNFWVKGILENSLHGQILLDLGIAEKPEALQHPWELSWQSPQIKPCIIPFQTKLVELLDQLGNGQTLLILGEPGSGKTTTLLTLTRDLVMRAEKDATFSIPVVFNLSSWQKRQKLEDWLVQELQTKYQVPKNLGCNWIKEQKILLMLDGLDEVDINRREACVIEINHFHQVYGQTAMVVCSRIRDYEALTNQLQFQGAILIQPLADEKIQQYLAQGGSELEGVREFLATETELKEMAKSPLILNMMAISYRGVSATELIQMSLKENHLEQLFNTYIDKMLVHRSPSKRYPKQKVIKWLSWLASQLQRESQTVFMIERLQPTWLGSYDLRSIVLTSLGLFAILGYAWLLGKHWSEIFRYPLPLFPLWDLLIITIIFRIEKLSYKQSSNNTSFRATYSVVFATIVWILLSPPLIFITPVLVSINQDIYGSGIVVLFLSELLNIAIIIWAIVFYQKIEITETLKWSFINFRNGFIRSFLAVLMVSGLLPLVTLLKNYGFDTLLALNPIRYPLIIISSIFAGITCGLINGFSNEAQELEEVTVKPNQGIWNSVKNYAFITIILSICFTLGITLIAILFGVYEVPEVPRTFWEILAIHLNLSAITTRLIYSFFAAIWISLLSKGGIAWVKHLILRLILFFSGAAPWNYAKFLNYASDRLLLRKIGGGYIFVHRLLLEHFSTLK